MPSHPDALRVPVQAESHRAERRQDSISGRRLQHNHAATYAEDVDSDRPALGGTSEDRANSVSCMALTCTVCTYINHVPVFDPSSHDVHEHTCEICASILSLSSSNASGTNRDTADVNLLPSLSSNGWDVTRPRTGLEEPTVRAPVTRVEAHSGPSQPLSKPQCVEYLREILSTADDTRRERMKPRKPARKQPKEKWSKREINSDSAVQRYGRGRSTWTHVNKDRECQVRARTDMHGTREARMSSESKNLYEEEDRLKKIIRRKLIHGKFKRNKRPG